MSEENRSLATTKNQDVSVSRAEMEQSVTDLWNYIATGKLNSLAPAPRAKLYVDFCQSLGLDPRMRPISVVENGLYISKAACEWYANTHNISRKVTKPEIVTLDNQKVIYIFAEASNGQRTEEDYYYRKVKTDEDIALQIRKALSAAKRRVTLPFISANAPMNGVWLEDDVEEMGKPKQDFPFEEAHVENVVDGNAVDAPPAPTRPTAPVPPAKPKLAKEEAMAKVVEFFKAHGLEKSVIDAIFSKPAYKKYTTDVAGMWDEIERRGQIVIAFLKQQFRIKQSLDVETVTELQLQHAYVAAMKNFEIEVRGDNYSQQFEVWIANRPGFESMLESILNQPAPVEQPA